MTYYQIYIELKSKKELEETMRRDMALACLWKYNPNRIKAIKTAGAKVAEGRNWKLEVS